MQIVFHHISYYSLPLIFFLKILRFKIYYIHVAIGSIHKKDKLFKLLKKIDIHPLSIESIKRIDPKCYEESDGDIRDLTKKYSKKIFNDNYLKKLSYFFDTGKNFSKIKVMFNDFLFLKNFDAIRIKIWADNNYKKKIIFLSFDFNALFINIKKKNIIKIVIPISFILYFFSILSSILNINFNKEKKVLINSQKKKLLDYEDKICLVNNHGRYYGKMFKKDIFYSKKKDSKLNENKLLHLSYDYTPIDNVKNFSLICSKYETIKIICDNFFTILKILALSIMSCKLFVSVIVIKYFIQFKKFRYKIKNFKKLKFALIDFDQLCPKELILALQSNKIKTIAIQERPLASFMNNWGLIMDEYFVFSDFFKRKIQSNRSFIINKTFAIGPYRAEWINFFKKNKKKLEQKIQKKISNYKKIIVILGYTTERTVYDSNIEFLTNWNSHKAFLNDIIRLAKNFRNNLFILRFKNLEWTKNKKFMKEMIEIKNNKNIILSLEYSKDRYVYNLLAKADLIIAKYTSAADEALSVGIPVIFHDYSVNIDRTIYGYDEYFKNYLFCHSYEELLKNTEYFFSNSSSIRKKLKRTNVKIHKHGNIRSQFKIKNNLINVLEKKLIN